MDGPTAVKMIERKRKRDSKRERDREGGRERERERDRCAAGRSNRSSTWSAPVSIGYKVSGARTDPHYQVVLCVSSLSVKVFVLTKCNWARLEIVRNLNRDSEFLARTLRNNCKRVVLMTISQLL